VESAAAELEANLPGEGVEEEEKLVALTPEEAATVLENVRDSRFFTLPGEVIRGKQFTMFIDVNKCDILQGCGTLKIALAFNGWRLGQQEYELEPAEPLTGMPDTDGCRWFACQVDVPTEARQMNFVFCADNSKWDNNDGDDYLIVVNDVNLRKPIPQELADKFDREANNIWADKYGASLFFTVPEKLKAGQPGAIYMNRKRSLSGLADKDPIVMFCGFNSWSSGNVSAEMSRAPMPQYDDIDWWTAKVNVPDDAFDLNLAFSCQDKSVFDNNDDNDYNAKVNSSVDRLPRTIKAIEAYDHAGGKLEIVQLNPRPNSNRRARWKEERQIRLWTPPGYHKGMGGEKGIPVLYLNDGINLYEDWLAHQGVSWNAGHCAASLIGEGKLPPFIIVGIDSPGPFRSECYLPFPPGIGAHDHRPDAAKWPGGNVSPYMDRIVHELLPLINEHWGGSLARERMAFGGASFGGVCALYAAMNYPHIFASVLVESPSLWAQEGKFLEHMQAHNGDWAEKIFVGSGTREYSATRDHDWYDIDQLLLHYTQEAVRIMEEKGVRQHEGRLAFQVQQDAGHIESAWGHRLYGSLQFLCGHWHQT